MSMNNVQGVSVMCDNCKNQKVCPYKESFDLLCMPLVQSINEGLSQDDIFTMELKCNFKDKELPYEISVDDELEVELDRILKEC